VRFCRGTSGSFGVPAQKDARNLSPDVKTLDAFALERWEVCHISLEAGWNLKRLICCRPFFITWCHLGQGSNPPNPLRMSYIFFKEANSWQVFGECC
jgi:hypothetical protein